MKKINILSIVFVAAFANEARADGAFHWVDSQGRDHYGSNPPKSARSIEPLSGQSVSRYSSSKLLKGYHGTTVSEDSIKEGITPKPEGKVKSIVPSGLPIEEETLLPELHQGNVTLKHDAKNRITECSVVVKNTASIPANSILVNFEFPDGTFVPGSGPESIDAASSAKYSVPETMLPFTLNGAQGAPHKPKVIIKGAGE